MTDQITKFHINGIIDRIQGVEYQPPYLDQQHNDDWHWGYCIGERLALAFRLDQPSATDQPSAGVSATIRGRYTINRPIPAKVARRKRHCERFKPRSRPPEGEHTTPNPKVPETPLSGDSAPQCGQAVTPETEQQP